MPVLLEHIASIATPPPGYGGTTDTDLREHALDLETLYGPHRDLRWLEHGERVSFADLAEAVADRLGPDSGVDMVVTVTPSPDSQSRLLPGALLATRLGGQPLVLGVNDQGAAGPFTALRLAANHLGSGRQRRAAIVLMEQPTLPPEPGYTPPPRAGAVLLVLGTTTGLRLGDLSVRRVPASQRRPVPRSGYLRPWRELAVRYAQQPGTELAVADRDEALGYDCRVRFSPADAAPARVASAFPPQSVLETRS